jgi:hypothetical protein
MLLTSTTSILRNRYYYYYQYYCVLKSYYLYLSPLTKVIMDELRESAFYTTYIFLSPRLSWTNCVRALIYRFLLTKVIMDELREGARQPIGSQHSQQQESVEGRYVAE